MITDREGPRPSHAQHQQACRPDAINPLPGSVRRTGKARAKLGKQTGQRARCGGAGTHRRITLTRTVHERPMLSRSHPKIHEPRLTGVSPVPRTSDSPRKLRNTRGLGSERSGLGPRRAARPGVGAGVTDSFAAGMIATELERLAEQQRPDGGWEVDFASYSPEALCTDLGSRASAPSGLDRPAPRSRSLRVPAHGVEASDQAAHCRDVAAAGLCPPQDSRSSRRGHHQGTSAHTGTAGHLGAEVPVGGRRMTASPAGCHVVPQERGMDDQQVTRSWNLWLCRQPGGCGAAADRPARPAPGRPPAPRTAWSCRAGRSRGWPPPAARITAPGRRYFGRQR